MRITTNYQMDIHEVETLLVLAEDEKQPLHVKRGAMEKLEGLNGELDIGNRHRLEKLQHAVRRQFDLAVRKTA